MDETDKTIKNILRQNYTESIFHTHVSVMKPKGKYSFPRQTLEEFWSAYCDYTEKTIGTNSGIFGIAERSQEYLPVLVDVDIKVKDEDLEIEDETLYSEDQLKTIISIYHSVFKQIINECKENEFICVVLEKEMYSDTRGTVSYIKNGFHLHFPYLFLKKEDQEVQLIPRVKEEVQKINLFANLGYQDSTKAIDPGYCSAPWLLYGSKKSETGKTYRVTKIFDHEMNKISLEKAFENYQIFDVKEKLINIKGKVNYYLPRILSVVPFGRKTKELKRNLISPLKEKLRKERQSSRETNYKKLGLEETITLCKRLLPMIADFRADDRDDWLAIGFTLYCITEGGPEGLDLWLEFSARCEEKYDENVCLSLWERMVNKGCSIGTLRHFASLDNPEEYKKLNSERSEKYIQSSLDGSHNDVAKALYEEYGDQFVCSSITNKIWYQFTGNIWEQIEEGVYLRDKISDKMVKKYIEVEKTLTNKMETSDKIETAMLIARKKSIMDMIKKLKNTSFKNAVMRESMDVFYDGKFKDKLDTDPFLIAFKNGVYDLKNYTFRKGRPEDYLSKTMPINYVEFSNDDEKVQEINTFLEQIFPDKSLREYFMDVSCEVFVGGNHAKTVHFWTGEGGDNGKSITQKFFEKMLGLGKFVVKLDTSNLTGKKPGAGSAYADLARTGGGVRLVTLEEPNADESINSGPLKHLSGNDEFYARDLFERGKDGKEINPMFKICFICNKLPRIKNADKAVWNRVRVIPFESTFCRPHDPAPDSYEEQLLQKRFPMDPFFTKKIPALVEPFAWVLLNHRKNNANKTIIEPEKVLQATKFYQKQNDVYRQFLDEKIIADKDKYIALPELYAVFKDWFKEGYPNHTLPVKNDIEDYVTKIWGFSDLSKKWSGYRFRVHDDDVKDGRAVVLEESDMKDYSNNSEEKEKAK